MCMAERPVNKLTRASPAINEAVHFSNEGHFIGSKGSTFMEHKFNLILLLLFVKLMLQKQLFFRNKKETNLQLGY